MHGEYQVQFENPSGLLLEGGTIIFEAGHFEGGMGGYHVGKFEAGTNRFRAEGTISRPTSAAQKTFGVFGEEPDQFEIVMVGHFDDGEVRGLLVRIERPYETMRFRLTPNIEEVEDAS